MDSTNKKVLQDLPDPLKVVIFSHTDIRSVAKTLPKVCKLWRDLCQEHEAWRLFAPAGTKNNYRYACIRSVTDQNIIANRIQIRPAPWKMTIPGPTAHLWTVTRFQGTAAVVINGRIHSFDSGEVLATLPLSQSLKSVTARRLGGKWLLAATEGPWYFSLQRTLIVWALGSKANSEPFIEQCKLSVGEISSLNLLRWKGENALLYVSWDSFEIRAINAISEVRKKIPFSLPSPLSIHYYGNENQPRVVGISGGILTTTTFFIYDLESNTTLFSCQQFAAIDLWAGTNLCPVQLNGQWYALLSDQGAMLVDIEKTLGNVVWKIAPRPELHRGCWKPVPRTNMTHFAILGIHQQDGVVTRLHALPYSAAAVESESSTRSTSKNWPPEG